MLTACGGRQAAVEPLHVSSRAPAQKPILLETLQLSVPRTLDLSHVDPQYFAVALGNDPVRIFEFVRDNIAYEPYPGLLRGPRGTLMAMAGNSLDRSALLAALLQRAGQQVRFARGTLGDGEARDLVSSIWAERQRFARGGRISDAAQASRDLLTESVKRDRALIDERLREAGVQPAPATVTIQRLVDETKVHYWVQWFDRGRWVDLDPSFADASPGHAYAQAEETIATLPQDRLHRVTIRVRVEEYTGSTSAIRQVLTHTINAPDLAGTDVVLAHMPAHWAGPAEDLSSAMTAAIQNTGEIKPILFVGEQWTVGSLFRQQVKTTGLGGLPNLLSGQGTRTEVPIATAEWVEFEFAGPNGTSQTAVREVFDFAGAARRASGRALSADEVRAFSEDPRAFKAEDAVYSLFFTTGRIEPGHLIGVQDEVPGDPTEPQDLIGPLRSLSILFVALADGLASRVDGGTGAVVFYPDSPRLIISEISWPSGAPRAAMDLRRAQVRAVAPDAGAVFPARILRGVIEGTFERFVVENATAAARREVGGDTPMSTSAVFEQARTDRVPAVLVTKETATMPAGPADGVARLQQEVRAGYVAVVPQRAVTLGGVDRLGWWRVDPRSGETVAVTDEGLHQATGEVTITKGTRPHHVNIVVRQYVGGTRVVNMASTRVYSYNMRAGVQGLRQICRELLEAGFVPR
jgi:hypothetical protein